MKCKIGDILTPLKDEVLNTFLKTDIVKEIIRICGDKEGFDIFEWRAISDSNLLVKIVNALYEEVKDIWREIDYVAALGGSGCSLASILSANYEKKFIFINDRWGITEKFQPVKPPEVPLVNKTVLLVDTVLRTGLTAYNAIQTIDKSHPILLVMTILPEWIDKVLYERMKDIDLYYLFAWNKRMRCLAKDLLKNA
ncbi:MAG: phosphoribosyltransferase [Thermoproteota archaeon]